MGFRVGGGQYGSGSPLPLRDSLLGSQWKTREANEVFPLGGFWSPNFIPQTLTGAESALSFTATIFDQMSLREEPQRVLNSPIWTSLWDLVLTNICCPGGSPVPWIDYFFIYLTFNPALLLVLRDKFGLKQAGTSFHYWN